MAFIPHTPDDIARMLEVIGVRSVDELFDEIPRELRAGAPGHAMADAVADAEHRFDRHRVDGATGFLVLVHGADRAGEARSAEVRAERGVEAQVRHHALVDHRVLLLADVAHTKPRQEPEAGVERAAGTVVVGPGGRGGGEAEVEIELASCVRRSGEEGENGRR